MANNDVSILLIEDDEMDVACMRRSFEKHRIHNPLIVARSATDGLAKLRGENGQTPVPRPFVILLDLNLPGMSGIEFLHKLRDDPDLSDAVVFVLTASDAQQDKKATYEKQIAGYLVKSHVGDDFVHLMSMLDNYWRFVELPPEKTHVR